MILDTVDTAKKKVKVVIVDDNVSLREEIRAVLEQCDDIDVIGEASDGCEAVTLSRELSPDVVVMDIVMPRVNGIDAAKAIRSANSATAVLFLTGYDNERYLIGLLESGAAGYLLKTAHYQRLIRAIRAIYEGEAVFDHLIFRKLLECSLPSEVRNNPSYHCKYILSRREVDVLKLAATGISNQEIAKRLCITIATVKAHLSSIFRKMEVASRAEATVKGIRIGLVTLEDLSE
jgi:NarL family two-component system response regulator LiaR